MNKKWLLGLGGIAAIALPVSTVVACGEDKKEDVVKKEAKVTVASPAKVAATVVKGTGNAYTLEFVKTDTATKAELEKALKGMVAKAADDTATVSFAGSWGDTAFDGTKDGTYTYVLTANGYNDVTFAVTVTGKTVANIRVNGVITLKAGAKLKNVAVTEVTRTEYTVSLPNGTDVSTDEVKALFYGQGTLTVVYTSDYKKDTAGDYTFRIEDSGKNSGKDARATLKVTIAAKKTA